MIKSLAFFVMEKYVIYSCGEYKKGDYYEWRKVNGGRFQDMKKFVRYADGTKRYSMGKIKFQELDKEAQACYKIGQLVLVNTEILDKYIEKYHITDSDFYK